MKKGWIFFLGVVVLGPACWGQSAPATQPNKGVTYQHVVRASPPMHLHVVTVDLSDPNVHVKVARGGMDANITRPWETTLMPVSEMCQRDGLFLAVNGNFFTPKDAVNVLGRRVPYFPGNWAFVSGWAMWDGHLYSEHPMESDRPTLVVNSQGRVSIGRFNRLPEGAGQAVAGDRQVVAEGRNSVPFLTDTQLAPRTAVGVDREGKKLILLVVDGRRPEYSAGMTERQVGDEMIRLGAWSAINLDGAGSSTLVMRDEVGKPVVMNRPSDGHDLAVDMSVPRSVADALGVEIDGAVPPATQPSH